jgi:hypothetical protein
MKVNTIILLYEQTWCIIIILIVGRYYTTFMHHIYYYNNNIYDYFINTGISLNILFSRVIANHACTRKVALSPTASFHVAYIMCASLPEEASLHT